MILSEHIGDLENAKSYRHYIKSVEHLKQLFEVAPKVVACDLHPGYFSTQFAKSLENARLIEVQHHWAHIASVLAEFDTDAPVIGIVADGTGYGTDGAVWGAECLIASLDGFQRAAHLDYYPLPGADAASKQAIRPLMGLLSRLCPTGDYSPYRWLIDKIEPNSSTITAVSQQIAKNINTVPTSSMGRLFDAAAAMIGLGTENHFEAQLPMALEAIADDAVKDCYEFRLTQQPSEPTKINIDKMIEQIIEDIKNKTPKEIISARFHNTIAKFFVDVALRLRSANDINTVAMSGGVFCNKFLANTLIQQLKQKKFSVLFKQNVPASDGGIALGQAAIALKKFSD